jgi:hypothetical protein
LRRPSWWWSHGSWIYNYLYNQCLSPLKLRVWTCSLRGVLDATLCDKVCQWLVTGWWFSRGTPVSCNNTDPHDITEILLIVALNNIILTPVSMIFWLIFFVFNYIPFIFIIFILGGVTYTNLYNVLEYPVGTLKVTNVTQQDVDDFKYYPSNTWMEKYMKEVRLWGVWRDVYGV